MLHGQQGFAVNGVGGGGAFIGEALVQAILHFKLLW